MDPLFVVLGLAALAVGVFIGLNEAKKRKALAQGGFTSKRSGAFWGQVQVYTTAASFEGIFEQVKRFFPPVIEGKCSSEGDYMMFKGTDWTALFERMDSGTGKDTYEFSFTQFSRSDGSVQHTEEMDAALTAIEKALLVEDPFTRVSSKPHTGLRSRPSLF